MSGYGLRGGGDHDQAHGQRHGGTQGVRGRRQEDKLNMPESDNEPYSGDNAEVKQEEGKRVVGAEPRRLCDSDSALFGCLLIQILAHNRHIQKIQITERDAVFPISQYARHCRFSNKKGTIVVLSFYSTSKPTTCRSVIR